MTSTKLSKRMRLKSGKPGKLIITILREGKVTAKKMISEQLIGPKTL